MSNLPHLPVLRRGRPYESLDQSPVTPPGSDQPLATISTVNAGIIRKDLTRIDEARAALKQFTVAQLMDISAKAGELFLNGTLALGDKGHTQTAQQYIETLSATSGLPHVMVKRNMAKIHYALTHMAVVLNGLTRGLDLSIIDKGSGEQFGTRISYFPTAKALGLVMPSNSPAVNSLWLPAIPLKTPVILKPGREEPWTPFRLIQAFIAAGCPQEAFGFYPTDHEGAGEILRSCGRALIFGDKNTTAQYAGNPGVQVHGPGYSKILIGHDRVDDWESFLDVLVESVLLNGGRSCINASGIWTPRYGREIAAAIGARLAQVTVRAHDDPAAELAAFTAKGQAPAISADIDAGLAIPGAEEITAHLRGGDRLIEHERYGYLLPTLVHCSSPEHPLANKEYMFPFAAVVDCPQEAMLGAIGHSLVVTAITDDAGFQRQLLDAPHIDRLNFGAVPTTKLDWLQPHEGNIVDFLYRARSFQRA